MKKILMILGSTREDSFNKSASDLIISNLESSGYSVEILDFHELPLINQIIEYPAPEVIVKLRSYVENFDAFWIITPEYNQSYPAVIKNLFDWLSRPVIPFDFETPTVITDKHVVVTSCAGISRGSYVISKTNALLKVIRMKVEESISLGLQIPAEAWLIGKFVLTKEQKSLIEKQVSDFIKFINS